MVAMRQAVAVCDWPRVEEVLEQWRALQAKTPLEQCKAEMHIISVVVGSRQLVAELKAAVMADCPTGRVGARDKDSIRIEAIETAMTHANECVTHTHHTTASPPLLSSHVLLLQVHGNGWH